MRIQNTFIEALWKKSYAIFIPLKPHWGSNSRPFAFNLNILINRHREKDRLCSRHKRLDSLVQDYFRLLTRRTILGVRWLFTAWSLMLREGFSTHVHGVFLPLSTNALFRQRPYPLTPARLFLQITIAKKKKPFGNRLGYLRWILVCT